MVKTKPKSICFKTLKSYCASYCLYEVYPRRDLPNSRRVFCQKIHHHLSLQNFAGEKKHCGKNTNNKMLNQIVSTFIFKFGKDYFVSLSFLKHHRRVLQRAWRPFEGGGKRLGQTYLFSQVLNQNGRQKLCYSFTFCMDKGPSNRVLGPKNVKKTKCLPESQESTMQMMNSEALTVLPLVLVALLLQCSSICNPHKGQICSS